MLFNKKQIAAFAAVLVTTTANAQIIPDGTMVPATATQTVKPVPAAYSNTIKLNFVRTWDVKVPFTNIGDVVSGSRSVNEVQQATQYLDGLGRPLQTVTKQSSPLQKDMVSAAIYDGLGREQYKYMPYVAATDDGKFHLDPFAEQEAYLKSVYNPTNDPDGEKFFYGKTVFEESPLNRPLKSFAAGNSWAGSEGSSSEHAVKMEYGVNVANEVILWEKDAGWPFSNGYYSAGYLARNVSTDEHGKRVVEYKDIEGHVLLKKVEIVTGANIALHTDWLCTYYLYDNFGMLRYVLPPKAVETIVANSIWELYEGGDPDPIIEELCFRYTYDAKHRMVTKKVPGAGLVYMVYDKRDRVVMMQDAKMRSSYQWLCTDYDNFNRPIRTYFTESDEDGSKLQGWVDENHGESWTSGEGSPDLLTETYYDDYSWVSGSGSGLSSSLHTAFTASADYIGGFGTYPLYAEPVQQSLAVKGMVTGSKTRVLGTTTYLYTVQLYDDKGRAIQVTSTNTGGGREIVTTQYDFAGKPLRTHHWHQRTAAIDPIKVLTVMEYDHAGRVNAIWKKINSEEPKKVAENTYNELGQLATKRLGGKPGDPDTPLETLDYSYNIRGWLNGINKAYTEDTMKGNTDRWFGMELKYDYGFSQGQYNGNIAGSIWKSRGSDKQRAYGFNYDNANRLLRGDFTQNDGGWNQSAGINYNMQMGDGVTGTDAYDANGNIRSMQQWGLKLNGSGRIDKLIYTYTGNKLQNVEDLENDPNTKLGDFRSSAAYMSTLPGGKTATTVDYGYDENGSLTYDKNKDISSITYNHLNLPQAITVTGKGSISYTYDATGNKLKKVTVDNTVSPAKTTTTDYMAGFVYENSTLQFMPQEEGRIRELRNVKNELTGYAFDYMVKDHLGNVRALLTDEQKADTYHAGFEDANASFEGQLFMNYNNIVGKLSCFTASGSAEKVQLVGCAKMDGEKKDPFVNGVVGAGKVLKVMAGDHVDAQVYGMFSPNGNTADPNELVPIQDVVLALFGQGVAGMGEHSGFTAGNASLLSSGIGDFLAQQDNYDDGKAYLNWILLDEEQFKLVSSGSGFASLALTPADPFGAESAGCESTKLLQANEGDGIDIKRNGYLYIYLSNTSTDHPAYFDQLHIVHTRGALLEETAYYPFGLTMAGISSKAAGNAPVNNYKYNGIEQNNDFNLNMYDAHFRNLDPQIGRFWQIDPKLESTEAWSPYAAMLNNPIRYCDPFGDSTIYYSAEGAELYRTTDASKNAVTVIPNDNLGGFSSMKATLEGWGLNMNGAIATFVMRAYGESYDIKGVFDFVDENAKNINTRTDLYQPIDGKGPLINEQSAAVEKKDGIWTVNPTKTDKTAGDPFIVNKIGTGVTLHTHDNEGRDFHNSYRGANGHVESGKKSVGQDGDVTNSYAKPGTGIFEMAAGKNAIYFFNNSGVKMEISRNAFAPKNFLKK